MNVVSSALLTCVSTIMILGCGSMHTNDLLTIKDAEADMRHVVVYLPDSTIKDKNTKELRRPCSCAEPSPDVAYNSAMDFSGKVQGKDEVSAEAKAQIAKTALDLAKRSQTLMLIREIGYRICESRCNGMSESDLMLTVLMERMKELLAIEQSRATTELLQAVPASDTAMLRQLYKNAKP